MKKMQFNSAEEMLDAIQSGIDLYCEEFGTYVFVYNDCGSICYYENIDKDEAKRLDDLSFLSGDYWGAFLGVGGIILDTDYWYEEHDDTRPEYLESPLGWCEKVYRNDWSACGFPYYESGVDKK